MKQRTDLFGANHSRVHGVCPADIFGSKANLNQKHNWTDSKVIMKTIWSLESRTAVGHK